MDLLGHVLGIVGVAPFVVGYILFVRWCDRFEPEPWWLVICAFLWGALHAASAGGYSTDLLERMTAGLVGTEVADPGIQAFGATVLAPLFEESAKGLGIALIALASALGLREFDGPLDGAILGGVVGLGFTFTEDIQYVAKEFVDSGFGGFVTLLFVRTVLLGLSHCTFTACTGLGFGLAAESKNWFVKIAAPAFGFGCAVMMHAMHNGLIVVFGEVGGILMLLISWVIDLLFFVLLALLVARDRTIVIRELTSEVGNLLQPNELKLVSTYFALGISNVRVLMSQGHRAWLSRRKKQLALVELAFLKSRRRRGQSGRQLDLQELRLRSEVLEANLAGVRLVN